jgi:hypothetical protein
MVPIDWVTILTIANASVAVGAAIGSGIAGVAFRQARQAARLRRKEALKRRDIIVTIKVGDEAWDVIGQEPEAVNRAVIQTLEKLEGGDRAEPAES